MMKHLPFAALLLGCLGHAPLALSCAGLTVTGAWIREPPPGATAVAMYAQFGNEGQQAIVIDTISSPDFAHGMLHESVTDGDRVRMRHVESLRLAPGEQVELAPGGMHAMLMNPHGDSPVAGAVVDVVLGCGDTTRTLHVPVQRQ